MEKAVSKSVHVFDFIKVAKFSLWISLVLVCVSIFLISTRGFDWGVDFAGGNQLRITFDKDAQMNRDTLEKMMKTIDSNTNITEINNPDKTEFFVYYAANDKNQNTQIKNLLDKNYPKKWAIVSENFVGSKIGQQFRHIAVTSTLVTLILILIYIGFRFDGRFGIAAIISLLHDVVIVLCFISFIRLPFTIPILAAILTIIGYSLNDTIVIFDRMRSETRLMGKELSAQDYYGLVNRSIFKSLTRTCLTAGTTTAILLILFFLGGEELKPMSLVLILGIIIGTISSNLVAPPVLYLWKLKTKK